MKRERATHLEIDHPDAHADRVVACCLSNDGRSPWEWSATRDPELVTCRRCLKSPTIRQFIEDRRKWRAWTGADYRGPVYAVGEDREIKGVAE